MRLACTSLFLAAAALLASQTPNQGRQVLDQTLQALGGDRFLNFHTRILSGRIYSFFHDELSGFDRARSITEYVTPLNANSLALRERQLLGKKQDYSFLYLPDRAFELTFRGARPVEDEQWKRYERTNRNDILYILKVRYSEPGLTVDYVGEQVYVSHHVDIVEITDAQSQTVRVYLDHNTHFPIHQTFEWLDDTTRQRNDEVTEYDKYRDLGSGVYWPYTLERSRNGYKAFQLFAESGEINASIPPGTFDLPPKAKLLKP